MLRLVAWPFKGGIWGDGQAPVLGLCGGWRLADTSGNFLYCIEWMPAGKVWIMKLIRKVQMDAALLQRRYEVYNNAPLRK